MGGTDGQRTSSSDSLATAATVRTVGRSRRVGEPGGGGADEPMPRTVQAVGVLVRHLRIKKGISLNALAGIAQLSPGLLSQIERGQGNPSLTTLIKLAHALDVPVGQFFVGETEGAGAHVRAGHNPRLQLAEIDLVYDLLTPHMSGQLGMIRAQIAAGWTNQNAPYQHNGEECIYLLTGELHVWLGEEEYHLKVGDSLTYDSSVSHWYHNQTAVHAEIIGAMTPPTF